MATEESTPRRRRGSHLRSSAPTLPEASMAPRRLTVGARQTARGWATPRPDSPSFPFLRLQGAWLACAGFAIGVPVKVHVSSGRLVIEAADPERVPRAEALTKITSLVADDGLTKRDFHELARLLKRRRCG